MKNSLSFALPAALFLAAFGLVAAVGCAAPDAGSTQNSNLTKGDDDDDTSSKKTKKTAKKDTKATGDKDTSTTAPKATATASTATPVGTTTKPPLNDDFPPTGTSSGAAGGDPERCFSSCIAKNPKAVQLDTCEMKCQDDQCADSCAQQAGCQDESCPAIATLMQCSQSCGLDQGEGAGAGAAGPGGPGGSQFPDDF